ncbi:MAG: phage Gp19/Gp15/Gp42 family protein [Lachnospiraceae bacterium]|nr:phage Gp19/Gp15/Gp42 family protein [Lachnospiraceae bacterium]
MLEPFATTNDVSNIWRKLKEDEIPRAEKLLDLVSDSLRMEADKVGKNLDEMIKAKPYFLNVVKSVTVDVVARTLMTSTDSEPLSQESQSALGYTWSGTYLVPGGGLFIKNSELARLGLKGQRRRAVDMCGED